MSVSAATKQRLEIALGSVPAAADLLSIASVIVSQVAPVATSAYSANSAMTGVDGTGSNAAPLAGTNTRIAAIDAELAILVSAVNALRTKLIASGVLV